MFFMQAEVQSEAYSRDQLRRGKLRVVDRDQGGEWSTKQPREGAKEELEMVMDMSSSY